MTQRDYGRKAYLSSKRYPEFIRTTAAKGIWDRITVRYPNLSEYDSRRNKLSAAEISLIRYVKQSEFNKPYSSPVDYKEMENDWTGQPGITWPPGTLPGFPDYPWESQEPWDPTAQCIFDLELDPKDTEYCPNDETDFTVRGTNPIYSIQITLSDDPATTLSNIDGYGTNVVTATLIAGDEQGPVTIEASMTCFEGLVGDSNVNIPESDDCGGPEYINWRCRGWKNGQGAASAYYGFVQNIESGSIVFGPALNASCTAWLAGKGIVAYFPNGNIYSTSVRNCPGLGEPGCPDAFSRCENPFATVCTADKTGNDAVVANDTIAACTGLFKKGSNRTSTYTCVNVFAGDCEDDRYCTSDVDHTMIQDEWTVGYSLTTILGWATNFMSVAINRKMSGDGTGYTYRPCVETEGSCVGNFISQNDDEFEYDVLTRLNSVHNNSGSPITLKTGSLGGSETAVDSVWTFNSDADYAFSFNVARTFVEYGDKYATFTSGLFWSATIAAYTYIEVTGNQTTSCSVSSALLTHTAKAEFRCSNQNDLVAYQDPYLSIRDSAVEAAYATCWGLLKAALGTAASETVKMEVFPVPYEQA